MQSFLFEGYPRREWAQLGTMSQEELAGAQGGQGGCWQPRIRRQKGMRQAAISPSVLFFILLLKEWCFDGGSACCVFSTRLDLKSILIDFVKT